MPERDELDRLIDSALADYGDPRTGLEQRMLARVSAEAMRPRLRGWMMAAIAVPGIAVLLVLVYLVPWNLHQQQSQVASSPAKSAVATVVSTPAVTATGKTVASSPRRIQPGVHTVNRVENKAVSRPKLDVFPTPQPLTGEEQALIHFVAQVPEEDRKAIIEAQQRIDEPVNISAIRIPPIQSEQNH
jgi:hypothetical protein